jgi:hypothetical protein
MPVRTPSAGMGVLKLLRNLLVYSLVIVGLLTIVFVVLSYGWDGEPPQVEFEATDDQETN